MRKHGGQDFPELREEAMKLLQEESSLQEIVRLVGIEALSDNEQLILDTAKSLREDYLQQDAFDKIDSYASTQKQYFMLKSIITFHQNGLKALSEGHRIKEIVSLKSKISIAQAKNIPEDKSDQLEELLREIDNDFYKLK